MKLKGLFVGVLLALFSVGQAQELVVAAGAQPDTLDPQVTSATSAFQATKSLYDTLVEVNREGDIVPALAESWEISDDALSYTFTLNEATFHDGSSFDSEDVKATLERIRAEETASPKAEEFATIEAVRTPDPRTVELTLSEPTPALLATLASGWGAMLPSELVAAGHDFGNQPVGTGPFEFDEWVRDSYLSLNRYPDYHEGPAEVERVTIRYVQDSAVQLQGLLAGDFHIIDAVASADVPTVEADDGLVLVQEPSGLVLVAALNNRHDYLSDVRVRQALNLAVDGETVLEVAYGGGTPVGTFMEAGSPWHPEGVTPYPFDPERARALLGEAGVPGDWRLDVALPQPYESHIQAGQIVQDMLQDVGVASDIRVVEWGVWLGEVYGGPRDFDLTVIGHTGKLDPTGRLGGYGQPDENYVGYDSERVTQLLEQAATTADRAARQELYTEVLEQMHEDAPFIYFGTPFRTYAHRAEVEGFWMTPLLDTFDFHDVTLN